MRFCNGCKLLHDESKFGTNRHGNKLTKCRKFLSAQRAIYYENVMKPKLKEQPRVKKSFKKIESPLFIEKETKCLMFADFFFAGDVA